MQHLSETGWQQVMTFVQPRIHEDIVHLVSRLFHRLMLRSVDLNMCLTLEMIADDAARLNCVASLVASLRLIRNIHMLNLSSEWATGNEANHVIRRFAFATMPSTDVYSREIIHIPLETLRLELANADELPVDTCNITTLRSLRINECLRISGISPTIDALQTLKSLHIEKCRRLCIVSIVPLQLQTLTIACCPLLTALPLNLRAVLTLATLHLEALPICTLPDMHCMSTLTLLALKHCSLLTTVGRVPESLEEILISCCRVLANIDSSSEFPSLCNLTLEYLPALTDFHQWSASSCLRAVCIQNCPRLNMPDALPLSLGTVQLLDSNVRTFPLNIHMLRAIQNLEIRQSIHGDWNCFDISHFSRLECLSLSGARSLDITVPTSVHKLTISYASDPRFRGFPRNIMQMNRITHLCLESCSLDVSMLASLHATATLCRAHNGIGWLVLRLQDCRLQSVPTWISENTALQELDLSHNNIREFPAGLAELVNLRRFAAGNDARTYRQSGRHTLATRRPFPDFIYYLPKLQTLELCTFFDHTLRTVRPVELHLDRLTQLTHLNLSGNALRLVCVFCMFHPILQITLSRSCVLKYVGRRRMPVHTLYCLERSALSPYFPVQIPVGLSAMTNLEFLDLSSNAITDLDTNFSAMTCLHTLIIRNRLRAERHHHLPYVMALSNTITDLHSLTTLDLMDSTIHTLPAALGEMRSLTKLELTHCGITQLPASITQLSRLQILTLASNAVQVLPVDLGRLQNLTQINLSGNAVSALPSSIMQLPQLDWMFFDVSTMVTYPPGFDAFIASSSTIVNKWPQPTPRT